MEKALAGVRVLDVSRLLPGPFAAYLLRNQGAAVLRWELPQLPDPKPLFGKPRRLDFTRGAGRASLWKALKKTDVFIEGFRPGLLDKRRLGARELLQAFPRLVYCSLTGYGRKGSRSAGHDLNYQARAGLVSPPAFPRLPVADLAGAYEAAFRIAAALRARERTGRGAYVDVSLTEAARSFGVLPRLKPFPELGPWWEGGDAFYRLYPCKDGGSVAVGALENSAAVELLRALGLERHLPLLAARRRHAPALAKALARAFASGPRARWARRFEGTDACVTVVG